MQSRCNVDACAAIIVASHNRKSKRRCVWTHEWLRQRNTLGSYTTLQNELRFSDKLYHKYLSMPVPVFDMLLSRVTPLIEKQHTRLRESISAGARLEATLLFLLSGMNYSKLQMETRIHETSLSKIIPEVCDAIYSCFKGEYLKTPTSEVEWLEVARGFQDR